MKKFKEHKKFFYILFLFLLMMGICSLILYGPMMNIVKDISTFKNVMQSYGVWGKILLVFMMVMQILFIFLPGEIIEIASGLIYGPIEGLILCLIGACIGSILIYILVKTLGIKFVNKVIGNHKIEEMSFLNKEHFLLVLFLLYFIPGTPKDILTYFIPLTKIRFTSFLFITTIARIPSIITSTLSGNAIGLENYTFSILVFIITAIVSVLGICLYKFYFCKIKSPKNL